MVPAVGLAGTGSAAAGPQPSPSVELPTTTPSKPAPPSAAPSASAPPLVAEFTSAPVKVGRGVRLDASPSTLPPGSTGVSYAWDFGADGTVDLVATRPVVIHDIGSRDTGEHDVRLVVTVGGRSAERTHPVRVPRDTVLVLLNGIEPNGGSALKGSYATVAGTGNFLDLLIALGCTGPWTATTIAKQCNTGDRARLYWSPYSYRGPNGIGAPAAYTGDDTFHELTVQARTLDRQVVALRSVYPQANLVFVGHSEGGTVAARWAADHASGDTPVITLDSMPYGFWPEDRGTSAAEDVANYCGPSRRANVIVGNENLSLPFKSEFQGICGLTWGLGGFRSEVSYDWRDGRVFAAAGGFSRAKSLTLLSATNRWDLIAPPWWGVSPVASGNKIVTCVERSGLTHGHGCIRERSGATLRVFDGIDAVLRTTLAAAAKLVPPARADVVAAWNANRVAGDNPAQLSGYRTTINVPVGATIVAIGAWGTGGAAGAGRLTCESWLPIGLSGALVSSASWQARSYVVFWRLAGASDVLRSRVRVLPFRSATSFTATVDWSDRWVTDVNPCG